MAAKRTTDTNQPQSANLNSQQKHSAIPKLEKRIRELEELDTSSISAFDDPRVTVIEQNLDRTLTDIFGNGTIEYNRYRDARKLYRSPGYVMMNRPAPQHYATQYEKGKIEVIAILQNIISGFKEDLEEFPEIKNITQSIAKAIAPSRRIFVVHGHDEAIRQEVSRFLEKIDLEPIILNEQVNQNRTIIEKIEAHSDVAFAVVLLTPDDVGKGINENNLRPRARQNVIFELGYFIGHLNRSKVCALVKGDDIDILSDYSGVIYTQLDAAGAWKIALAKELAASGIDIDYNKIFKAA